MYIKAESVGEASHTHPVVGDDDSRESPLSEEVAPVAGGERLKSVVVVKERTDNEKNDDDEGEGSTDMETGEGGGGCDNTGEP